MQPNHHATTILEEQPPLDEGESVTPRPGHFQQNHSQPLTTADASWTEDIQVEIIAAHTALGFEAANDRRQISRGLEGGSAPPAADMPLIFDINAPADFVVHNAWYRRLGAMVTIGYSVAWQHTDGPTEGNTLTFELPFEINDDGMGSSIQLTNSTFRTDDLANAFYELTNASPTRLRVLRNTIIGAVGAVEVKLGGVVIDGGGAFRSMRGTLTYQTDGVRNPEWPFIRWLTLQGVYVALPATKLAFEYESAKVGDSVELLDGALAVIDTFPVGVNHPVGQGSFGVLVADTYRVRLRGVTSTPFVVVA